MLQAGSGVCGLGNSGSGLQRTAEGLESFQTALQQKEETIPVSRQSAPVCPSLHLRGLKQQVILSNVPKDSVTFISSDGAEQQTQEAALQIFSNSRKIKCSNVRNTARPAAINQILINQHQFTVKLAATLLFHVISSLLIHHTNC